MTKMLDAKIVFLVVFGLGYAASSELDCSPGDLWKIDCNTCVCTQRGFPKCTAYNCHPDAYHQTLSLTTCRPHSRWRVDCNFCECSKNGEITCSDNNCDANELTSDRFKRQAEPTLPSRDACKPGVAWKDDCNRCFCRENGKAECTKLLCFPLDMPERRRRDVEGERAISEGDAFKFGRNDVVRTRRMACTEGQTWTEGCNQCYCSKEGTPACTKKLCLPEEQENSGKQRRAAACKEGDTWKEGCNSCHCSKDGTAACTRKLCSPDETGQRRKREIQCEPGSVFKIDCNTCRCNEQGVAMCTLMACQSQSQYFQIKPKREVKRCTPGQKWKDVCNDCTCTHTGYPACTLKACDSQSYIIPNKPNRRTRATGGERCTPGQSWKEDCNWCTCQNGIPTCTYKACPSQSQYFQIKSKREVKRCTPGQKWKDDCNDCTCTHTGYAACTLKACDSQSYIIPNKPNRRTRATEGERCTPGQSWKEDCNWCKCQNGIPMCTDMACPSQSQYFQIKSKREVKRCTPGQKWKDDCNDCTCTHTGYAACTLKACNSQPFILPSKSKRRAIAAEDKEKKNTMSACTPGAKWKEGCNNCHCLANGTGACTRRLCRRRRDTSQDVRECRPAAKMCGSTSSASEPQARKKDRGKLRGRGRCTPGSTWIQNCSQCYCDEQNNVECVPEVNCSEDQEGSSQGRNRDESPKGRGRCEPGSTWEVASQKGDWCDSCACDANGVINCLIRPCQKIENTPNLESETRTKRATISNKKSERWCRPGDTYYFTCDVCPCGVKGITGCNSRTCRD